MEDDPTHLVSILCQHAVPGVDLLGLPQEQLLLSLQLNAPLTQRERGGGGAE